MGEALSMTSSPPARRFDWSNLALRAGSATVLIPTVVAGIWYGGGPYLFMLAIAIGLLAIEWGKMSAPDAPAELSVALTVIVLSITFAAYIGWMRSAWLLTAAGAVGAAWIARGRARRPMDAAYGVIYLAPASIALIWLRQPAAEHFNTALAAPGDWSHLITANLTPGVSWTLLLFAVTWSADIAAFAVGNLLKGPKLWPRISPNKTWSGFFGGLLGGALAALAIMAVTDTGLTPLSAVVVGAIGAFATMAGDLWESMLKRRFGVKDSGDLIPGHGGLLDRVDGLMFAVVFVAAARLVGHWGWVH
jgi:phosphatidate cytidylyltransferase